MLPEMLKRYKPSIMRDRCPSGLLCPVVHTLIAFQTNGETLSARPNASLVCVRRSLLELLRFIDSLIQKNTEMNFGVVAAIQVII